MDLETLNFGSRAALESTRRELEENGWFEYERSLSEGASGRRSLVVTMVHDGRTVRLEWREGRKGAVT